jgi:hypothetical protein
LAIVTLECAVGVLGNGFGYPPAEEQAGKEPLKGFPLLILSQSDAQFFGVQGTLF